MNKLTLTSLRFCRIPTAGFSTKTRPVTLLIVFWKFPFRKAHTRYDHFAQWTSIGEAVSSYFVANLWATLQAEQQVKITLIYQQRMGDISKRMQMNSFFAIEFQLIILYHLLYRNLLVSKTSTTKKILMLIAMLLGLGI